MLLKCSALLALPCHNWGAQLSRLPEAVMFLTCIWEVPDFNLGQNTDYPDRFSWFFVVCAGICWISILNCIMTTFFHILANLLFISFLLYTSYFTFHFRVQSWHVPFCSFYPQYYEFSGNVLLIHICWTHWLLSLSVKMTALISVD